MPLFDVSCPAHGQQEVLAKDSSSLACPVCGSRVERAFSSPPVFRMDFRSGWDMGAGRYFSTKRERDNWIAEAGTRKIRD